MGRFVLYKQTPTHNITKKKKKKLQNINQQRPFQKEIFGPHFAIMDPLSMLESP